MLTKIRAASNEVRVDCYELGIKEEFSKQSAIAILSRWLAGAYVRVSSNGTNTNVRICVKSKHNLGSSWHLFPHLEGPRKQLRITLSIVWVGGGCDVKNHNQDISGVGFVS